MAVGKGIRLSRIYQRVSVSDDDLEADSIHPSFASSTVTNDSSFYSRRRRGQHLVLPLASLLFVVLFAGYTLRSTAADGDEGSSLWSTVFGGTAIGAGYILGGQGTTIEELEKELVAEEEDHRLQGGGRVSWKPAVGSNNGGKNGGTKPAKVKPPSPPPPPPPPPGPNLDDVPVRIHFRRGHERNEASPLVAPKDCPVTVVFTTDERSADLVIYSSDSNDASSMEDRHQLRKELPYQKIAIKGVEAGVNRPSLYDHHQKLDAGKANDTFDYEISYRLESDIPDTYGYGYFNFGAQPVAWEDKRQDRLIAALVSNCHPKNARTLVLRELMTLLPGQVDSFGSCENNADVEDTLKELGKWEQTGESHTRWNIKVTTASIYKFSFALENSNDVDYVSEKFFQAMETGSIPIHLGSPTFSSSFLPHPNAAFDISKYAPSLARLSKPNHSAPTELTEDEKAGIARLAERIQYLGSEEGRQEYEAIWAWKKDDKWKQTPFGQVTELAHHPWTHECRLAGLLRGKEWAKSTWKRPPGRKLAAEYARELLRPPSPPKPPSPPEPDTVTQEPL